ncbi:MAG: MarR family transcriptional regulator [Halofilum sp. (in: g-proteobacteria)]|nr:MarR family transcriptional regulator [Halofilum sp. (in: g-proteobacteria)]
MSADADAVDPLALSNQLCFSVYSTAHAFTRLYAGLLRRLDVTYTQYLVLLVLWEREGLTVKEIGERLTLDSGTLTPLLRRLEQSGYVRRERDGADQRRVHVYLTSQGHDARPDVERVREVVFGATGMSQEELRTLQGRLERLRAALEGAAP